MYVDSGEVRQKSLHWMSEADDQSTGESRTLFKIFKESSRKVEWIRDKIRQDRKQSIDSDTYRDC